MADKQRQARAIPGVLLYTGPAPAAVGVVPLPEGWPAADHADADAARYAAKVASGNYKPAPMPGEEE